MNLTPADPSPDDLERRRVLRAVLAMGGAGVLLVNGYARGTDSTRFPTPANALGPFYPTVIPADRDADLTQVTGHAKRAQGTVIVVTGRVLTTAGKPIGAADIEVWQANAFGRYMHPADSDASGPLDPDFQGYGRLRTDAEGNYRLKTIKPAPYSGRTAHLHLNVAGGGVKLTTQMFFAGEPQNATDGLYRYLGPDGRRAATATAAERKAELDRDALALSWDIVLAS